MRRKVSTSDGDRRQEMTSCDPLTSDCQKKTTTMMSEGERDAAFSLAEEGGIEEPQGLTLTPFLVYLLEKVSHCHFCL
jgi:hypothetical protein